MINQKNKYQNRKKNITLVIILLCSFFSKIGFCQSDTSIVVIPYRADPNFNGDTTINRAIEIDNEKSIIKYLGESALYLITKGENMQRTFPYVCYTNTPLTQYLRIVLFPGNACCQYFEVGLIKDLNHTIQLHKTRFTNLFTESGITLGQTKEQVFKIKGRRYTRRRISKDIEVYRYKWGLVPISKADDPNYITEYTFKNGKLIKFGFGSFNHVPSLL